ncbi:hypothetical protein LUZ60_006859 [Juncus effusus]|nr:hypothetical protein LUZ60_006859 [Juncus effusus]
MSFRAPTPRNLSTPKENLDDTKRRRIGGSSKAPTNPRSRSVLSTVNSVNGDNSSDIASVNGGLIEFNSKEDVEMLLAEKLRSKKNDFKGKSEQQSEYIKKLRACITWQMEQVDKQLAEQETLKKNLEAETAMKLELESELSKKIEEQRETIERLTRNCESLEEALKKEIAEKTAAIESFEKERESKKVAESSVTELNHELAKSKEELQQVSDQLKTVQDNIKRLTEYNNSLQQYNSNLQSEGAKKEQLIQRVQKEKSAMIDSMAGLKEQINKLKNQLDSSKVSQQEAISQKESLKNELNFMRNELQSVTTDREIHCLKVKTLTEELENYKELTGKSVKDLDYTIAKVSDLEETCGTQREQMAMLQRQLSAANEKLKLADISAVETISEFEETKKKLKFVQDRLYEAEQRISEGENVRKKLHNTILELKGNIRVFCRVRPVMNDGESNNTAVSFPTSTEAAGRGIDIITQDKKYDFTFDKVFDQESSQEDVFVEISQLVQSALDGYKVCIFAYGQTGSGKTYTMMGKLHSEPQKGLIPRSLEQIFVTSQTLQKQGWKYRMQASMLEIYDENIYDLLLPSGKKSEVAIRHDDKNSYVIGLTCKDVFSIKDVSSLLKEAAEKRSVGKTQMNEQSSRSHFVFTLRIDGSNEGTEQQVHGVLNLIDLAGSERLDKSGSTGDRLKETQFINKSLSALSDVIFALGKKDKGHVPYRNSKLTDLLQPCLGGDSKTLMFVNVSPEASSAGETLCSLRFAARVNSCEIGVPRRQT